MIVEALVNLKDSNTDKGYAQGDILAIMPENSPWGVGDLKGRIVVQIDMDLPCENGLLNCAGCKYQGIEWDTDTISVGDTANQKTTCEKEKYTSPNAVFTFNLSDQGFPVIDVDLISKRRAYVDLSGILSAESLSAYLTETSLTKDQVAEKLAIARKESNLVSITSLVEK